MPKQGGLKPPPRRTQLCGINIDDDVLEYAAAHPEDPMHNDWLWLDSLDYYRYTYDCGSFNLICRIALREWKWYGHQSPVTSIIHVYSCVTRYLIHEADMLAAVRSYQNELDKTGCTLVEGLLFLHAEDNQRATENRLFIANGWLLDSYESSSSDEQTFLYQNYGDDYVSGFGPSVPESPVLEWYSDGEE